MNNWLQKIFKFNVLRLIYMYDNILVLLQSLRPSTHFIQLRTIKFSCGDLNFDKNSNLCIFIIYEVNKIPEKTLDFLRALKQKNVLVFTVINSKISSTDLSKVQETSDLVLQRNNTGKDIGGYKDAYHYIFKLGLNQVKRIIFSNDSVVYLGETTHNLIDELCSEDADLVGYSHVQEIHYHVQSFLFSCSNHLVNHKKFMRFWSRYKPIDRRRYMIGKGEVGITKSAIKSSATIKIINSMSDIYKEENSRKILELMQTLPTESVRKTQSLEFLKKFNELESIKISKRIKDINIKSSGSANYVEDLYQSIKQEATIEYTYKLNELIASIAEEISYKNNATWGTFIFRIFDRPLVIKRDLFYRGGYRYEHLRHLFEKYFPKEHADILSMMKMPAKNHHKGIKLIMFENGII